MAAKSRGGGGRKGAKPAKGGGNPAGLSNVRLDREFSKELSVLAAYYGVSKAQLIKNWLGERVKEAHKEISEAFKQKGAGPNPPGGR